MKNFEKRSGEHLKTLKNGGKFCEKLPKILQYLVRNFKKLGKISENPAMLQFFSEFFKVNPCLNYSSFYR